MKSYSIIALSALSLFLAGCVSNDYPSMRTGQYDPNGRVIRTYPGTGSVGPYGSGYSVVVDQYGRQVVVPNRSYGGVYGGYGSGYPDPYYGGGYGSYGYPSYGYGYGSPYGGGYYPAPPRHQHPRNDGGSTPLPPRVERPSPPREPGQPPRNFRELFPRGNGDKP